MKINPILAKFFHMGLACPSPIIHSISGFPSRLLPRIAIFWSEQSTRAAFARGHFPAASATRCGSMPGETSRS